MTLLNSPENLNTTRVSDLPGALQTIAIDIWATVQSARLTVGKHLLEARNIADHGQWRRFLQAIEINDRRAQRMMAYAKHLAEIGIDETGKLPSMRSVLSGRYGISVLQKKVDQQKAEIQAYLRDHPEKAELYQVLEQLRVEREKGQELQNEVSDLEKQSANNRRILSAQKRRILDLEDDIEAHDERLAIMEESA